MTGHEQYNEIAIKMIEDHVAECRSFRAMISSRLDKMIWAMFGGMAGLLFLVVNALLHFMPIH